MGNGLVTVLGVPGFFSSRLHEVRQNAAVAIMRHRVVSFFIVIGML